MRKPLPLLLCLSLLAPACMAQSVDDEAGDAATGPVQPDDAPRSAFGKVMGIMIEALRQEALQESRPLALDTPAGPTNEPILDIEVGSAFLLPPPRAPDVQPCEQACGHEPDGKLRIASQK